MGTISKNQLDLHELWIRGDENGKRLVIIGANLQGADLQVANLQVANLLCANLRGANLQGANLQGANGIAIASDASKRLQAVANVILNNNDALDMAQWHTCETTHCLAGWAIHQAGELGRLLEASVGNYMAGLQLLGPEAAMHFYDTNEDAIKWLHDVLDRE